MSAPYVHLWPKQCIGQQATNYMNIHRLVKKLFLRLSWSDKTSRYYLVGFIFSFALKTSSEKLSFCASLYDMLRSMSVYQSLIYKKYSIMNVFQM